MKKIIVFFLFSALFFISSNGFAQNNCGVTLNNILEVGPFGAAFNPVLDLVHVRANIPNNTCGFPNPAVRLDVYQHNYFGQFSLASATNTQQNSALASEGDVILLENPGPPPQTGNPSPTPRNLILTNRSPSPQVTTDNGATWHQQWPFVGGGSIRLATTVGCCEREGFTLTSSSNIGLGNSNPLSSVHIGKKILLNGGFSGAQGGITGDNGAWCGINYNFFNDVYGISSPANTNKRIEDGPASSIGFAATTDNVSTWSSFKKDLTRGFYISEAGWGSANSTVVNGNALEISHSRVEFIGGGDGDDRLALRLVYPIYDPNNSSIHLLNPYAYFPNKVLIGTDGSTNTALGMGDGMISLTGMNTTITTPMLAVNGLILCKELLVKISSPPWPDYVFQKDYKLMPLADLEKSVKENKHLPDLPSAKEIETGGVNVVDLEAKLVKKVEELTQYVIEQDKRIKALEEENQKIQH